MTAKIAPFFPFRGSLNRLFLVISCAGLSLLTACANVIPPCTAKTSPPASELRNTKWELVRWNLPPNSRGEVRTRQIPQGDNSNPIQIVFDGNGERISGSTGCNRFTARINEDARGFTLDQIASTKMACTPQRMELERDFLYELNDYRNIVRNGDQLLMIGANREVLSFTQRAN
ncbi:MAG: META domain-containing protein [Polynucleobacter sp. 24-46-87]|jgi:heat shock protein HslJ|uniref:META domain-containing protein n=1 Tax=Polynucleobacter sp. es-EL-1 TaxID=1855652 RepID=UPI000BD774AC|nr:META domain-containing protein [Polynucleobacter sp. es-EL-1]OZA08035.1 MAG: META domain-containing protein [Polynucleobacter sp. 24-46-87]QWE10097.1 META domain-containing protein [Polynucleobacter sp. es-EL-1]